MFDGSIHLFPGARGSRNVGGLSYCGKMQPDGGDYVVVSWDNDRFCHACGRAFQLTKGHQGVPQPILFPENKNADREIWSRSPLLSGPFDPTQSVYSKKNPASPRVRGPRTPELI